MKTTQVEFLRQLSSAETMDAFIKSERIARMAELVNGARSTESKSLSRLLINQLTESPEARGFVGGFCQSTFEAIAHAEDNEQAKRAMVVTIAECFAIGFAYAASLIDSSVESAVN